MAGNVKVTDGDTLVVNGVKIRLYGIDAPERAQKCTAKGEEWPCGRESTLHLKTLILQSDVRCKTKDVDRYGRTLAICYVGSKSLNAAMVRAGYALAYRYYSKLYVRHEEAAKSAKAGMWRGEFIPPWKWRRKRK